MQDVILTMIVLTLGVGLGLGYELRDVKRTLERIAGALEGIAEKSNSGLTDIHTTLQEIGDTLTGMKG